MKWSQRADRQVVEAVVGVFSLPASQLRSVLDPLTSRQWIKSYYWLDAGGVALYLLARLEECGVSDALPEPVLTRLRRNRADNRKRSAAMFSEFADLNRAFQSAGIRYCNLKGFTLSPDACAEPELRRQIDLDFLVDGPDLQVCRGILEDCGYTLRGETDSVWEFKTTSNALPSIDNFYEPTEHRCAEVHFLPQGNSLRSRHDERLDDLCWMTRDSLRFPALPAARQFVGQGTHLFGHLCGTSTRLGWVLEFSRQIERTGSDDSFWQGVRQAAEREPQAALALGVACRTATLVLGTEIPAALSEWTVESLPAGVALWTERCARKALLSDFPGTKLGLLLLDQIHSEEDAWLSTRRATLLPRPRVHNILPLTQHSGVVDRVRSQLYQARYVLFRLRFHLVAGMQYALEARHWRNDPAHGRNAIPAQAAKPQHSSQ